MRPCRSSIRAQNAAKARNRLVPLRSPAWLPPSMWAPQSSMNIEVRTTVEPRVPSVNSVGWGGCRTRLVCRGCLFAVRSIRSAADASRSRSSHQVRGRLGLGGQRPRRRASPDSAAALSVLSDERVRATYFARDAIGTWSDLATRTLPAGNPNAGSIRVGSSTLVCP
jgi:hypothetical protein